MDSLQECGGETNIPGVIERAQIMVLPILIGVLHIMLVTEAVHRLDRI